MDDTKEVNNKELHLDYSQRIAVDNIISTWNSGIKVTTLSGGAGYGKTFTTKYIVERLIDEGVHPENIIFAAPTGKAAKVLNESELSQIDDLRDAMTIHRLLGYRGVSWEHDEYNHLFAEYVFVDESSMVGSLLFERLLRSISSNAKFLFLGDYRQLQPVEPGCPYLDIVKANIPSVTNILEVCHRQKQGSLIANACESIVSGTKITYGVPGKNTLGLEREDDFFIVQEEEKQKILQNVAEIIRPWFENNDDYVVLVPQWRGEVGIIAVNEFLQNALNSSNNYITIGDTTFKKGDRVRQTKNDYDLEVFNGFIGTILDVDSSGGFIVVDFNGEIVTYSEKKQMFNLSLGYAVSIHSSQGSGYKYGVIIADKSHTFMWTRQLIYVAVSRFKELCYIVGQRMTIARSVRNNTENKRSTYLSLKFGEPGEKEND